MATNILRFVLDRDTGKDYVQILDRSNDSVFFAEFELQNIPVFLVDSFGVVFNKDNKQIGRFSLCADNTWDFTDSKGIIHRTRYSDLTRSEVQIFESLFLKGAL